MKKVLKIVSISIMCVLLCGALLACSSPAPAGSGEAPAENTERNGAAKAEGKWLIESVTSADGESMTGEDLAAEIGEMYYEFQSGGKLVVTVADQDVLGTWEQTGAEVKLEANGESYVGLIDEDTLTLEVNDAITVLVRE